MDLLQLKEINVLSERRQSSSIRNCLPNGAMLLGPDTATAEKTAN
jgi:hypothetical protein